MSSPDPFSLEDKRILVTGASSGIGKQIAITCSRMGAQVIITGRNAERLQETAGQLQGDGHTTVVADLTQQAGIDLLVEQAGVLNGLVHAAGISRLVPVRMINQTHLDETFSSNVYAPLLLTKGLLAKRRIAQQGSIVFISAVASHIGPLASAVYSASKGALMGAMRTLGLEVAKQGIRANCVVPGYVRSPMLESLEQTSGKMEDHTNLAPLGLGEPEDVAYAVVFYLSDASRWITRNYFVIDGGLTVQMDVFA